MKFELNNIAQLPEIAQHILTTFPEEKIFLFYGNMGAGKTTFINVLCKQLGVQEHTSSPTFSIVNEYLSPLGPIYHFDFYRLKDESEAFDLGYEEYFFSNNYCFIEWPEKIPNLLPEHYISIKIEATENQPRTISFEKF